MGLIQMFLAGYEGDLWDDATNFTTIPITDRD